jgi:hypothetical protein
MTSADNENKLPLWPLLHGVERDRQTIVLHLRYDPDIDEHAGPQLAILIGKDRFERNRSGSGIRLVIERGERAGIKLSLAVCVQRNDFDRTPCESLLDVRDVGCTQCKHHADRLDLVDHHQSIRLARKTPCRARVNDVADIEEPNSGDAVKWHHQFRIAQLGFGVLDRRLVGFDNGLDLGVFRSLRRNLLLRRKALFFQRDVPAEVDPPIFKMRLVAGKVGLRLVEPRVIGARIELRQELALFDVLAVLEVDAEDLFRDHAAHRSRIERRHIADPGQHDREILSLDRVAMTGTGCGGLGIAAPGLCAKCCHPS